MGTEAVIEARTLQAIAMGDLNAVDAGLVQGLSDARDLFQAVAVTHGMHTVAQGHV
ncbi:hypothetical protein D3C76_1601300 [compost metagenome]